MQPGTREWFDKVSRHRNQDGKRPALTHPECPPDILGRLSDDRAISVRVAVASHPSCPHGVLPQLAEDPQVVVAFAVAGRKDCPARVTEILARNGHPSVLRRVAEHPNATPTALTTLVAKTSLACQSANRRYGDQELASFAAARHERCPVEVMETLVGNGSTEFRLSVSMNPSCPESLLRVLARDESRSVRLAIASRSDCPADVLRGFAQDPQVEIRAVVAGRRDVNAEDLLALLGDGSRTVRQEAGRNEALARLLDSDLDEATRVLLARRVLLDGRTRVRPRFVEPLATDPASAVRRELVKNKTVPWSVLAKMSGDPDRVVQNHLARRMLERF